MFSALKIFFKGLFKFFFQFVASFLGAFAGVYVAVMMITGSLARGSETLSAQKPAPPAAIATPTGPREGVPLSADELFGE